MFDLSDRPLVWIKVEWDELRPGVGPDDLAVPVAMEINVQVELKEREDLNALFPEYFGEGFPEVEDEEAAARRARIFALELDRFCAIVSDWRKVADKGVKVDYSREFAARVMRRPGFSLAFDKSYLAACVGKVETRKGN